MKLSFIATVLNEEKNIEVFLESILSQSISPDEIIIVDGGSTDKTFEILKKFDKNNKKKHKVEVFQKKGNRSIGRNYAIKKSTGDIILCSDAGNILDKNWVKYITIPFRHKNTEVVAGYYRGLSKDIFQKSLIPYVLVTSDRLNPQNFLPATRSMAFKKSIWRKLGGFNERLSFNEDYDFAKRLKNEKIKIVFAKQAIAYWIPVENFRKAFKMFYNFAAGDAEAKIYRPKVFLIFLRYIIGIFLLCFSPIILFFGLGLYCLWSVLKNYKYVKDVRAIIFLPALQFLSDAAVIYGTFIGIIRRWGIRETL